MMRLRRALCAVACAAGAAGAAVPLDDGPQGVTCQYIVAAARVPWQRAGGDWADADGAAHGDRAFSSTTVGPGKRLRTLQWDVSTLARRWTAAGPAVAGGVLLRDDPPATARAGGIVNLRSREHPDSATRPLLDVQWDDGSSERLPALADTFFACPTYKSSGGGRYLKVGGGHAALLVFDWQPRGRSVRRALLVLHADQVYGHGLTIGSFQPLLPAAAGPSAARPGLAAQYSRDDGIEQHPDVLFVDRFEPGRKAAAWSGKRLSDEHTVGADAGERFEPFSGRALKVTIQRGQNTGLNAHYRFARQGRGGEPEEAFVRYYLRLGDSWNPDRDGGKLPGFAGTYNRGGWGMRPADGSNGWSARGAFFKQAAEGSPALLALRGIGSYVYHADRNSPSGAEWGWGLGPSGLLLKNRWYSVEQQLKLNRPGQSDGELRAWIDGELVFEKTGLRFRDVADLKIESLWMNVYHGGTAKPAADLSLFIDNLVIARSYIGPLRDGGR